MMKQVYLFLVLIITCWGCQDMKVGYLKAENAGYLPNELEVKKTLDPVEDAVRMANEAPWVTQKIQGVLGTSTPVVRICKREGFGGRRCGNIQKRNYSSRGRSYGVTVISRN